MSNYLADGHRGTGLLLQLIFEPPSGQLANYLSSSSHANHSVD